MVSEWGVGCEGGNFVGKGVWDGPRFVDGAFQSEFLNASNGPIECHPGHHLGMSEMPHWAPDFPDAVIGLAPDLFEAFQQIDLKIEMSQPVILLEAAGVVQNVAEFPKNVQLQLLDGGIAHAYRRSPAVAGEPRHFPFQQMALA